MKDEDMYNPQDDRVYLWDVDDWPTQIVHDILSDLSTFDTDLQFRRLGQIAGSVNAYKRYPKMMGKNEAVENIDNIPKFSTQFLLDNVFFMWRAKRHVRSGMGQSEASSPGYLERLIREIFLTVLRRIHSETPPIFVKE